MGVITSCYVNITVERRTFDGTVELFQLGWLDPIPAGGEEKNRAGIEEYEVIAYEVVAQASEILPVSTTIQEELKDANPIPSITLPDQPMLYELHLTVKDYAGNYKEARGLIFYDSSSQILLNTDNQMNSGTATEATDYVWQINNGPVNWRWDGFFYNDYLIVHNVLKPIAQDSDRWPEGFDQHTGWLPTTGSRNIDGIIVFQYHQADDEDFVPDENNDYANVTSEEFDAEMMTVVDSCSDGDKYIMWMKVCLS